MPRALRLSLFLVAFGALAAGCSHTIESPQVTGTRADPDLACNAKPATRDFSTVAIHGSNMTPMPSKTLEGTRQLILPKVQLNMVEPIAGATANGPITITDDPANASASRVKWTSEELMSFDIKPEDKLPTGVMSIVVTNPDGDKTTTIDRGLAIVPAPAIATLKPPAICDDQADQTVVVTGSNFLVFDDKTPTVKVGSDAAAKTYTATFDSKDCTPVTGNFVEKNVQLCTAITIKIPKGDFKVTAPTKVPVVVTNPAPADCQSSEAITLTIEPPPKVDSVVPATVCEGGSQLTINGSGFIDGAKVTVSCSSAKVDASTVKVTPDGKQIAATFGPGAVPGESCDVIVQNPDGCIDIAPHQKVTVTTGPIVFYVDPPVVYNGINTRITIFATTIKPPLPDDAVTIVPNGASTPVTKLTYTTVASYPNRLQAIVPTGQAGGTYDLTLKDSSGCFATLPKAITVVDKLTVNIASVTPPFGWTGEDTSIQVVRDPSGGPFVDSPRLFLNPSTAAATDVAVPLTGVSFFDKDKVTGIVPKGTPVKKYDLVVVNPDGTVGLKKGAYEELTNAPPEVLGATPSSIAASTGQKVTLSGKNFDATDMVSLRCKNSAGADVAAPAVTSTPPVCASGSCTQSITIDGSSLAAGDVCVVRVTNADGSYGEYSAIGVTTPSLNLNAPQLASPMNIGRRALSAAAGKATSAQRFVYAIGGDSGATSGALDSYEFAPVDLFGAMGAWTVSPVKLGHKRTLAGATTVGRYIYDVGGDDGTGPVTTAERALILSPRETPEITDLDLALGTAGLEPGDYHYRVSATFDAGDTDNPGGESLPSDEFSLRIPSFPGKKVAVTLIFRAPVDALGAPLAGVAGYRVYRTAKAGDPSGSEVLLGTVTGASTLTFVDDGSKTPGTEKPLPLGSTGNWLALPNMPTKRSSLGVTSAFDPGAADTFYVYAIMGADSASTVTGSYDYLKVTIAANGRQTVDAAWKAGTTTNATPRDEFGTWLVDAGATKLITDTTEWIYVGGGKLAGGTLTDVVDAAKVQAGGALGAWQTPMKGPNPAYFSAKASGYGVCAANDQLFVFGGFGGSPSAKTQSTTLASPLPNLDAWNAGGTLTLKAPRYLLSSTVQSAFIFVLGGKTDVDAASKTTETVIW